MEFQRGLARAGEVRISSEETRVFLPIPIGAGGLETKETFLASLQKRETMPLYFPLMQLQ